MPCLPHGVLQQRPESVKLLSIEFQHVPQRQLDASISVCNHRVVIDPEITPDRVAGHVLNGGFDRADNEGFPTVAVFLLFLSSMNDSVSSSRAR